MDNAATTWPKPPSVISAFSAALSNYGANPGRSGHDDSLRASERVYSVREKLNSFFDGYGAQNVAFSYNCTYALNLAIKGIVPTGGHIVISSLEHNSVLRPVAKLAKQGIATYSVAQVYSDDNKTIKSFKNAITDKTAVVVCTAASNVFGNILPLRRIAEIAHSRGARLIVDAAQGAGVFTIDMSSDGIDCLCMPGHKSLYGVMGTGVLLFNDCVTNTLIEGGTGSMSFDSVHPHEFPDMLESGTVNVPGIICLESGLDFIISNGIDNIFAHEIELLSYLFDELSDMGGILLYTDNPRNGGYSPVLSFNVANMHSEEVAVHLNSDNIAVRAGYHCAPLAHISFGTQEIGAVRVSPSVFTEKKDINLLINSLRKIAKSA